MTAKIKERTPLFVVLGVAFIALADASRRVNAQGPLTAATFAVAFVMFIPALVRGPARVPGRVMPPIALVLFVMWAGLTLTWTPARFQGVQNFLVYGIFVMTIAVTAAAARRSPPIRLLRGYRNAGLIVAVLYLVFVALHGPNTNLGVYTARSAAGSLVLPIVAAIVLRVFCKEGRWSLLVLGAGLAMTLSRGVTADVLILTTLGLAANSRDKLRTVLKFGALVGIGALAVYEAYLHYTPFRLRFELGDGYRVGGFTLGSSGRANLWSATYRHWLEHPWIGHGVGSAEQYILQTYPPNAHPHNDYLRILHDTGVLGMGLWAVGIIAMLAGCWRSYKSAQDPVEKAIHFGAILGTLSLCIEMIPDNPVTAIFVVLPLAALIGVSRGLGVPPDSPLAARATSGPASSSALPSTSR